MSAPSKVASLLARNAKLVETYKAPPLLAQGILKNKEMGRKATVILSCSDPRIPPEKILGLEPGEAGIIRNAGGRAQTAVRDILALDAVGRIGTLIVIHHTDCGMSHTDEAGFTANTVARHPKIAASQPGFVFGAISDPNKTIVEDVKYLKSFDSFSENFEITGMVFDTAKGTLTKVDA